MPEWSFHQEVGDVLEVSEFLESAQATLRIAITENDVAESLVGQCVSQRRIMGREQDAEMAGAGNDEDALQQGPSTARMNAVVDLLDDDQSALPGR